MPFRTEADLLTAVQSPEAEEGDHLELKRELPPGDAGTREIGKDLAAMALGGGVILVGVDEGPPPVLTPITLAGQRERVEAIARAVDPPVSCQVSVLRKDPPVTGYLVITVPVSDDAPHAHQWRFYGRSHETTGEVLDLEGADADGLSIVKGDSGSPVLVELSESSGRAAESSAHWAEGSRVYRTTSISPGFVAVDQ